MKNQSDDPLHHERTHLPRRRNAKTLVLYNQLFNYWELKKEFNDRFSVNRFSVNRFFGKSF